MVMTKMMFGIWMDYRHFFLKYVLSKIDECSTATDVEISVNDTYCSKVGTKAGQAETIQNVSKRQVAILDSSMDMVTHDEEDLFLAADELALQDLLKKTIMVKTVARWRSM